MSHKTEGDFKEILSEVELNRILNIVTEPIKKVSPLLGHPDDILSLEWVPTRTGTPIPDNRKCYNDKCDANMSFGLFLISNLHNFSHDYLVKIWKNPYIQLFCCTCIEKKGLFEKVTKKRARLLAKAERIWFKFGLDLG